MSSPLSRPPLTAAPASPFGAGSPIAPDSFFYPIESSISGTLARLGPVLDRFFRVAHILYRRSRNGSLPGWIADAVGSSTAESSAPVGSHLPTPELILTERGLRLSRLGRPPLGIDPESWPATDPESSNAVPGEEDPHLRALLERDAWMAVFWSPPLRSIWSRELRESNRRFLEGLIPPCWLVSPTPLPHQAVLPALGSRTWAASRRPDLALRFPRPGGPEGPKEAIRARMTTEEWLQAVQEAESRSEGAATMLREQIPRREAGWDHSAESETILLRPDYTRNGSRIELTRALAVFVTASGDAKRGEAILGVAPCQWT